MNLLSNAVKFTATGSVTVDVRLAETAAPAVVGVRIDVRDTGIGIDRDRLGRLFEPFVQADASVTRRFGGTGLGLAISKRLVELMDGRLWATSQPGDGSTFAVEIPWPIVHAARLGTSLPTPGAEGAHAPDTLRFAAADAGRRDADARRHAAAGVARRRGADAVRDASVAHSRRRGQPGEPARRGSDAATSRLRLRCRPRRRGARWPRSRLSPLRRRLHGRADARA